MTGNQFGRGGGAAGRGGRRDGSSGRRASSPVNPEGQITEPSFAQMNAVSEPHPVKGTAKKPRVKRAKAKGPEVAFEMPAHLNNGAMFVVPGLPDLAEEPPHHLVKFKPNMDSYHGAQFLPGKLRDVAYVVKKYFMNEKGYPHVRALERASGEDTENNTIGHPLLDGMFGRRAVITKQPPHELWRFFMDSRLFSKKQWMGITVQSEDRVQNFEKAFIFPRAIRKILEVKVKGPAPSGPPIPKPATERQSVLPSPTASSTSKSSIGNTSEANGAILPPAQPLSRERQLYYMQRYDCDAERRNREFDESDHLELFGPSPPTEDEGILSFMVEQWHDAVDRGNGPPEELRGIIEHLNDQIGGDDLWLIGSESDIEEMDEEMADEMDVEMDGGRVVGSGESGD